LVPGGAPEALNTGDTREIKLFLNKRKSFVKLALMDESWCPPSGSGRMLCTTSYQIQRALGFDGSRYVGVNFVKAIRLDSSDDRYYYR